MAALHPGELGRLLVDTAVVYGLNPATEHYDVPLLTFVGRLTGRSPASLGTGVGSVRTSSFHLLYGPGITLPGGYWEVVVEGTRYTPVANSGTVMRDFDGSVVWQGVDLDQLTP